MPDLARSYAKLRGSPIFVLGLMLFVASWLVLHYFTHFDSDFGALNLCLSTEASVSLAFFTMMGDRQTSDTARAMAVQADAIEEIRAMAAVLIEVAQSQREQLKAHTPR